MKWTIRRAHDGTWRAMSFSPGGGSQIVTYPSGQAVMVALDGRNRPKRARPKSETPLMAGIRRILLTLDRIGNALNGAPARRDGGSLVSKEDA